MSLTEQNTKKVASLARLKVEGEELKEVGNKLNNILHMMDELKQVDTENVLPLSSVADIHLRLRADIVNDGGNAHAVLRNAPEEIQGFYGVPKVVD